MSTRSRTAKPSGRATGEPRPELTSDAAREPAGSNGSNALIAPDSSPQASRRGRATKPPSLPEPTSRRGPDSLDNIRLTGDRLMVRIPENGERTSKAGLLIPATAAATHKRCIWSEVVLVAPETRGVRRGDLVLFVPQAGVEVEVDAETYLLLRERDVQAVASERVDRHAGQYL